MNSSYKYLLLTFYITAKKSIHYTICLLIYLLLTRKPCYRRRTAQCRCKFWYISNFRI